MRINPYIMNQNDVMSPEVYRLHKRLIMSSYVGCIDATFVHSSSVNSRQPSGENQEYTQSITHTVL